MLTLPEPLTGLVTIGMGLINAAHGLLLAAETNPEPKRVPTVVEIDDGRLTIGDERYRREDIARAYQLAGDPPRLRMRLRRRLLPIDVELSEQAEVDMLLEALHYAPSQRAITFRAAPIKGGWRDAAPGVLILGCAAVGAMVVGDASVGGYAGGLVGFALFAAMSRRFGVLVGSDGVRLERTLWPTRFVPWSRVSDVSVRQYRKPGVEYSNVVLTVDGEGPVRLTFQSGAEADAFVARAQAATRVSTSEATLEGALTRGAEEPREWIARLRALTSLGTLRTAAVGGDQLFAILESPTAPAEQRAAAAIAISSQAQEPAVRLRIDAAADATASPELREVLDAVREGREDDVLAEALSAVENDDTESRQARRTSVE